MPPRSAFRVSRFAFLLLFLALAVPSLQARKLPSDCVIVAVEKQRALEAAARLQKVNVWARVLCIRFADRQLWHAVCVYQPRQSICVYNGAKGTRELRGLTSREPLAIARAYYNDWQPLRPISATYLQ